jgi:hypothetical protein
MRQLNLTAVRRRTSLGISVGAAALGLVILLTTLSGRAAAGAGSTIRYVDGVSGSNTGDCSNPATPCAAIGYALSLAVSGDEIWVTAGTHTENLTLTQPVALLGSYIISGSAWLPGLPRSSVIEGSSGISQTVVKFETGADGAILDGFTLTGGEVDNGGGGITIESASPVIRSCLIWGNTAQGPLEWGGGGILIGGNSAPVISNTIIMSNSVSGGAGGVRVGTGASFTLINSVIAGNAGRPPIHANDVSITLFNVTITDHGVDGGLFLNNSQATIVNSILWETMAPDIQAENGSIYTITYSNVEDGILSGVGNISADRMFVGNGDYHLLPGSPATDAGTAVGAPVTDLDGTPRDDAPDMGAYEWVGVRLYLPVILRTP